MSARGDLSSESGPKVAIVILNWNGLKDTLACLESLDSVSYENFVVVVIDNGSDNQEAAVIKEKYPDIAIIQNSINRGFAGGCNQGIKYSQSINADYTLLLNNDTVVTNSFLETMINFYETQADAGFVSPQILYLDKTRVWFAGAKVWLGIIRHHNKGKLLKDTKVPTVPFLTDYVPGTCLLVSNKVIEKIGPLDDRYFAYYEDLDWTYKVHKIKLRTYVLPAATIYHKKSGSTSEGGHIRFSKIPAFYIARNGLLISSNLKGVHKIVYILAHLLIKLPLSLLLLVQLKAWKSYLMGVAEGMYMISKRRADAKEN